MSKKRKYLYDDFGQPNYYYDEELPFWSEAKVKVVTWLYSFAWFRILKAKFNRWKKNRQFTKDHDLTDLERTPYAEGEIMKQIRKKQRQDAFIKKITGNSKES